MTVTIPPRLKLLTVDSENRSVKSPDKTKRKEDEIWDKSEEEIMLRKADMKQRDAKSEENPGNIRKGVRGILQVESLRRRRRQKSRLVNKKCSRKIKKNYPWECLNKEAIKRRQKVQVQYFITPDERCTTMRSVP